MFLLLSLLVSGNVLAIEQCDYSQTATVATPVEEFRKIAPDTLVADVRKVVGQPTCISGEHNNIDVYQYDDGTSIHVIYLEGRAGWAFFFDPATKAQELLFGEPNAT